MMLYERRVTLELIVRYVCVFFFFSSRRRHTRLQGDWSSDVCSSDLTRVEPTDLHGRDVDVGAAEQRADAADEPRLVLVLREQQVAVDRHVDPEPVDVDRKSVV